MDWFSVTANVAQLAGAVLVVVMAFTPLAVELFDR